MIINLKFMAKASVGEEEDLKDTSLLSNLNGFKDDNANLSLYLEAPFEDIGIEGGTISLINENDSLYTEVKYYSPSELSDQELDHLIDQTISQLTDGYGEEGITIHNNNQVMRIDYIDTNCKKESVSAEQLATNDKPKKARRSPIFKALESRDLDKARTYLSAEHLYSTEKWGFTPLMIAIRDGHTDLAIEMIKQGSNIKHTAHASGATPLSIAAMSGDIVVLKELISMNVELDKQSVDPEGLNSGMTALMWACNRNHPEFVKTLLENGASVNLVDSKGNDAFYYADTEELQSLLKKQ